MTLLGRSIVRSEGYLGGPGYNVIHWSAGVGPGPGDADGVEEWHDTLFAAFDSVDFALLEDVTYTIEESVAYFDDSDGVILGSTTDPAGDRIITGTGVGVFLSRATQAVVAERTDVYVNGRRLQGRIFFGPIQAEIIGADGQITDVHVANIGAAFDGCISGLGGRLAVWHRPSTPTSTDGTYGDVQSVTCRKVPGTLRSRKT